MKKLITITIFLLFQNYLAAINADSLIIVELIDEVRKEFAPDKRVAIFEVKLVNTDSTFILEGKTNLTNAKNVLEEKLNLSGLDYHDQIKMLPDEGLGDKIYGIVNLSVANIRSKPSHPAELATQALLGTPVKVLEYDDSFFRVQTPDDYISWVDVDGIYRVTKAELDEWLSSEKVIYLGDYGFCYSEPNSESARVSDLVIGDIIKFVGEEGEYIKVEFPDSRSAFVEKNKVMSYSEWLKQPLTDGDGIVDFAKTFMGVPYLWGGTSSKGMDCSGFTKTVYYMNGLVLPRDASQQVHTGELIDTENGFDNLQPGDLLFFGFRATEERKERITHVAIYIGNLEYIHASGRVKLNSFNPEKENYSEFRYKSFIRAKRILSSVNTNGINTVGNNKYFSGDF